MLYFHGREDIISTLQGFRQDNPEFVHTLAASIDNIISELDQKVPPSLYKNYSTNLRKAVDTVFSDSPDSDLANQFRSNVSRFAAYKAYAVAEKCRNDAGGDKETIEAYLRIFNRYQAAEYNTARSRARTGKQWNEFQENNDIFPNIKWILSRSVEKREEHIVFAGRVWAKDDPFWTTNQPGSLWNCKCDWQETDEPVTDGNPSNKRIVNQGLEGNPAVTGEIFTDNASYIKHAGGSTDIEKQCKGANRDYCIDYAKHTYKSPFVCNIAEQNLMLDLSSQHANKHFVKDLYEDDIFWLKNEILINPNILKDSTYIGYKECDKEHNTSKKTLSLKRKSDFYYYYKIKLKDKDLYLHLGHYTDTGNLYLYSATLTEPKNTKTS